MPKDEWKNAEARRKVRRDGYEQQEERAADYDANVDEWIARQAEQDTKKKPKKKR